MTNDNNDNINNFFTIYFILDSEQEDLRRNSGYSVENIGTDNDGILETLLSTFASGLNRLNNVRRNNQIESTINNQSNRNLNNINNNTSYPRLGDTSIVNNTTHSPFFVLFDLIVNGNTFSFEFERSHFNLIETLNFFENLVSMRTNRIRMKKEQVNKLRRFRVTKKMLDDECTICMNKFKLREMARHLPCDHIFHSKCVDKWLMKHSCTCPVCRKEAIV